MKNPYLLLLLLLIGIFEACSHHSATLETGDGDDVIIYLEITDTQGIEQIDFRVNGLTNSTLKNTDFIDYTSFSYGLNCGAEGTFELCILSVDDTLCEEFYVEMGYRPQFTCTKDSIITISSFY